MRDQSLKQYIIWPYVLFSLALRAEGLENILYLVTLFWNDVVKVHDSWYFGPDDLFSVFVIIHLTSFSIPDSIILKSSRGKGSSYHQGCAQELSASKYLKR